MNPTRNFCIIAHIDHGKSTMADRFLELTGLVEKNKLKEQMLDSMDLERERGITIKLQPVHMTYRIPNDKGQMTNEKDDFGIFNSDFDIEDSEYALNLIDTPGHVDFSYEVSRSLAAVEGAILLVDATQGIQAQTLANLPVAQKHKLTIIPVVNKIDLPNAEPERVAFELAELLKCDPDSIIFASGKTGQGVELLLQRIIRDVPAPKEAANNSLTALVFDSQFSSYRGVIAHVRVMSGSIKAGDTIKMMANQQSFMVEEVGVMQITPKPINELQAGDIGYIVTGLKRVADCRVGDTMTLLSDPAETALPGYHQPQPMVYASLFSAESDTLNLRTALEKLSANDAALAYEPHYSEAFGAGFRVGFLGLLHLEITKERLEREFNVELIITTPEVAFHGDTINGYEEPWIKAEIVTPPAYIGQIMDLVETRCGEYQSMHYLGTDTSDGDTAHKTAILEYDIPLAEIILDFNDQLKSITAGYASLSYDLIGYRPGKLVELSILIAGDKVSPFTQLVPVNQVESRGRILTKRLKDLIPKQMFEVSIQAAANGKIIARENVPAMRKDVTAKLYGGDVTRKRKLLEKQKEGKRKMRQLGRVSVPTDVFIQALKPSN